MATERIIIGTEPVQITDGTSSALITVIGGYAINFADSETSPNINAGDFVRDRLIVNPPIKLWLWSSPRWSSEVAVTRW